MTDIERPRVGGKLAQVVERLIKNRTRVIAKTSIVYPDGSKAGEATASTEAGFKDWTGTLLSYASPAFPDERSRILVFSSKTVVTLPIIGEIITREENHGKGAQGFDNVIARLREVAPAVAK